LPHPLARLGREEGGDLLDQPAAEMGALAEEGGLAVIIFRGRRGLGHGATIHPPRRGLCKFA